MRMYWMAKSAATKHHKVGGRNNGHVLSHSSGGQKSRVKVLAGLVSSELGCEGEPIAGPLPSFWGVAANL